MTVICQLHEAGRRLSASNIRGRMTVICQLHQGRLAVICQLHEAGWQLSVSSLRQNDAYLLVT
jgi:hypothetical protein